MTEAEKDRNWRRSLRGNVDRNIRSFGTQEFADKVVPYVGTWIEMEPDPDEPCDATGRSLRGNVDRNMILRFQHTTISPSFPTWERG